jgi:hypothetical protein
MPHYASLTVHAGCADLDQILICGFCVELNALLHRTLERLATRHDLFVIRAVRRKVDVAKGLDGIVQLPTEDRG